MAIGIGGSSDLPFVNGQMLRKIFLNWNMHQEAYWSGFKNSPMVRGLLYWSLPSMKS